jgi:predicted nucleotidyltransferase
MLTEKEILSQIKTAIQEILPDAKVYLFGSRARGDWHKESDWDILVLTNEKVNRNLKKQLRHKIFPISLLVNDFIDCTIVSNKDWNEHPAFYVLHHAVKNETVAI